MGDTPGTLERLAEEIGAAFSAFQDLFAEDNLPTLFLELGLDPTLVFVPDATFSQKLSDAVTQATTLADSLDDFVNAVEAGDASAIVQQLGTVLDAIARLLQDVDAIATDLQRATAGSPDAAAFADFAVQFAESAIGDAFVRYLDQRHTALARALELLGLTEATAIEVAWPPDTDPQSDGYPPQLLRRQLHLDKLDQLNS